VRGDRVDRPQPTGYWRRGALGAVTMGAFVSVAAAALLRSRPPGGVERWTRQNHVGRPVTLFEGPAYAVGAAAGALAGGAGGPAVVAGLGAAAFGAVDDLAGDGSSKGLRGHFAAARRGELTTGVIKVLGLGVTGLLSAWMIDRSRERSGLVATVVGGGVIAGSANIANLLDLRPGRALKVVLLVAAPIVAADVGTGRSRTTSSAAAAAAAGAALGLLPDDLAGRTMMGDTGSNSAGALLGAALVARSGSRGRFAALAAVTFLTLASERVSFTKVIESTPGLRELDGLGRPPRVSPDLPPPVFPVSPPRVSSASPPK